MIKTSSIVKECMFHNPKTKLGDVRQEFDNREPTLWCHL